MEVSKTCKPRTQKIQLRTLFSMHVSKTRLRTLEGPHSTYTYVIYWYSFTSYQLRWTFTDYSKYCSNSVLNLLLKSGIFKVVADKKICFSDEILMIQVKILMSNNLHAIETQNLCDVCDVSMWWSVRIPVCYSNYYRMLPFPPHLIFTSLLLY